MADIAFPPLQDKVAPCGLVSASVTTLLSELTVVPLAS
jgi:hypothetical protein